MTLDEVHQENTVLEVSMLRAQAGAYIEALVPHGQKLALDFFSYFERACQEAVDGTLDSHRRDDYTSSMQDFRHGLTSVRGKFGELKAIALTAIANKHLSIFSLCDSKEDQANGRDFWHQLDGWKRPYSVSVKSTEMELN